MNSEGRRFARLFRKARDLTNVRQVDLRVLAADDGIEILLFEDRDPGCAACLFPAPDGKGGAIFLQPGQSTGRMRFSIAHELGHYHIPTHGRPNRSCDEHDLQATGGFRPESEWEANSFAAELLMPEFLFGRDLRTRDISFDTAVSLASSDEYNVSITAAALRIVETSRECCALIAMEEERVLWQARSDFYFRMGTRGQPIRSETLAAGVFSGESPNPDPREVDPLAWFDDPKHSLVTLLESTHHIPTLNQVLSLLWVPDQDW